MSGWEPTTYVKYVFEDDRVVGEEHTPEPEWSQDDRDLVMAQWLHEKSLGPHGFPMSEAVSNEGNLNNPDGSYWWRVTDPDGRIDWAEKAAEDARERFRERFPNESMNGRLFPVEKVSRVKPADSSR